MLKILAERLKQKHRTVAYPDADPALPERFKGLPVIDPNACTDEKCGCIEACPTDAIRFENGALQLDMGACIFCGECETACEHKAISFTRDWRLAGRSRKDLLVGPVPRAAEIALEAKIRSMFGRSLKLRQVSAGGCNGCEADVNVLGTVVFDLGRFGIQMVASPRHADGLLITGPVTENMKLALKKTYDAVAAPKIVIASGACAISGGPFAGHAEVLNGADSVVPVDLYVPGCPPHPYTLLDGLLGMLDRLPRERLGRHAAGNVGSTSATVAELPAKAPGPAPAEPAATVASAKR